jgi:hypothetical protein
MLRTVQREIGDLGAVIRNLALIAVGVAIYTELRKPPAERTWHGKLAGVVPYDFRVPSVEALRLAYWNPRSQKIFTDRPLGVGWAINVPTLLRRVGVTGKPKSRTTTASRA